MLPTRFGLITLLGLSLNAQQPSETVPPEFLARVAPTTATVLTGKGAGRLDTVSIAVVVRSNGILLLRYAALKDASEVHVQLHSGEVFDRATLIGVDERRGVAAIKISGTNLPVAQVAVNSAVEPGAIVYAVTISDQRDRDAAQGIAGRPRMADEIPGLGQGFRVLPFTTASRSGAPGGPLLDAAGRVIGIVVRWGAPGNGYATPIEAVAGLADGTMNAPLGEGTALRLQSTTRSVSSQAVIKADPIELLKAATTVTVQSDTEFLTVETLEGQLSSQVGFGALGILIVRERKLADLEVRIDRPIFTRRFNYSVVDPRTTIVLDAGSVRAISSKVAAGRIAAAITAKLTKVRGTGTLKPPGK